MPVGAGVSEETHGQDTGAEALAGGVAGADQVAAALALAGASRERADDFAKKQEAFIEDQRHHLHEQFKQLRLGIREKRLGVILRAAAMVVGLLAAAARRLAEAGCTAHQIMAITGRKTLREVTRYTEAADRHGLAETAMAKIGRGTSSGKL